MGNVLITPPSVEPVSLTEAKDQLRISHGDEDTLITGYIEAARTVIEEHTGLALINQTWRLSLDRIPSEGEEPWWNGVREGALSELTSPVRFIELPRAPLISVTSFMSYDEADNSQAFTGFYTDTSSRPGRVSLRSGGVWPSPTRGVNGIEITYVAGFGNAASSVPADIKIAIRQLVAHYYENREVQDFDPATAEVPLGVRSVMKRRKIAKL